MKHLMNCLVASAAVLALAQGRIVFKDKRTDPSLQIEGNKGMVEPDNRFELDGNVIIRQPKDGTVITCANAKGDLVKVSAKDAAGKTISTTDIDNVKLTGGIRITQQNESGSSELTGTSADYNLDGSNKKIKLTGNLKMTHNGAGQSKSAFTLTGTGANAILRKQGKDSKLSSATLTGPIVFKGNELYKTAEGTKLREMSAKSNSMTYTLNEDESGQMVMRGNIELQQSTPDEDGPEVTGAQTITLDLNKKGEVVRVRLSAGEGSITTVYKKKGNA
ncbi:MAG TPA: hypothetical protein VK171_02360 [Fimbriimonas sp.]|nr:hypothetical protein [Fimbriimonas sp.]